MMEDAAVSADGGVEFVQQSLCFRAAIRILSVKMRTRIWDDVRQRRFAAFAYKLLNSEAVAESSALSHVAAVLLSESTFKTPRRAGNPEADKAQSSGPAMVAALLCSAHRCNRAANKL